MGHLLLNMGILAQYHGDYRQATALFEECLDLYRGLGNSWFTGVTLGHLGTVARVQGDYARAVALYSENLALARKTHDSWLEAYALRHLGRMALLQGDHARAADLYTESLSRSRAVGDKWVTYECLEGLAGVASGLGNHQKAALLFGAAEALRETLGLQLPDYGQRVHDQHVAAARAAATEEMFRAAWANGRGMALEDAIAFALTSAAATPKQPAAPEQGPAGAKPAGLLTGREQEVAALIARGMSNREIASSLVITERTAESHVQHILNKLGLHSRARIAVWAAEHGLHKGSPA